MKPAPFLSCTLHKPLAFADGEAALEIAIDVPRGQWLALLGESGAGKTTLLQLLAGLGSTTRGHIVFGNTTWLDTDANFVLPTRQRRIGYVFQDLALFPNMTVRGNVAFARPRDSDPRRCDELLELVGLHGLATRHPAQLSGGQQQRLALARALAAEPRLLLLDEPLAALDARMRREMQDLLLDIRQRGLVDCALVVTHDAAEAVRLADRIVQLERGRVIADTAPDALRATACQTCPFSSGQYQVAA